MPNAKPPTFSVVPLSDESQITAPRVGRPRKLKMPPLPQAILDGMTELEHKHFDYFLESFRDQYPDLTAADQIMLVQAALEYINTLRVQATQLSTGQVITMSRQHPGVQMRAYMDQLSITRKSRKPTERSAEDDTRDWLTALSQA